MSNWTYTLEKQFGLWHWELKDRPDSMFSVSACTLTKRGAKRAMKKYIKRETKRKASYQTGTL